MKFIPRPVQIQAAKFSLKKTCAALFLDMGEGKTSIICMVIQALKAKKIFKGAIIITTLKIVDHDVWPKEIKKYGFGLSHIILHGKDKDKLIKKKADIYLTNFESLPWLLENIKHLKAEMLIIDESDKVKANNTNRFKTFKKILFKFTHRYLLSGTPNTQSYMDLFSQIYILDEGERLGRYITGFRNEYFTPVGYKGYQHVLQEDGADRINKALEDIVFRPEVNSVILNPLKVKDVILKLTPKLKKEYKELEREYILEVANGTITAQNGASKRGKLKQFCNGAIYDEDRNVHAIHKLKINAAKKIVKSLKGSPIMIGYEYKHDLQALQKAFPEAPYFGNDLKGKKPTKKQALLIEKHFNMGLIPVLLGQISSVAHGLNLQGSSNNVMSYSLIDKYGDLLQFIARIRRSGQKKQVIHHRLIIEESVDEDVLLSNKSKDRTLKFFLNAMKKRIK